VRRAGRLGLLFALLAVPLVLLGGAGATVAYARFLELTPVTSAQGSGVVVTVGRGETLDQLAAYLESQGLIRSATWFAAYARVRGIHLRAGTYLVDSGMGASEMVNVFEGPTYCPSVSFTIPPGFTVDQVASRVASTSGLRVTRQQYLDAVAAGGFHAPFLSMRPAGDSSLEGFLFPDTYSVPDCASAHQIIQMQLDEFGRYIAPQLPTDPAKAYAALVTASIVQAEILPADDGFAKGASVIDNRLAASMPLQIDATVTYGLHLTGQPPSTADLAVDTPYNTYLHTGLPPTPIGEPGTAAVQAALHPASTDYLYYVSDACGNTYFSATFAEHQQQVQEHLGRCP
jgi:UPF0755 protein